MVVRQAGVKVLRTLNEVAVAVMLVFLTLATGTDVWAATCPAAPSNWAAENCTVNGTGVCTLAGGVATCDVSWSDASAEVNMVTDYDPLNSKVQAWGDVTYTSGGVLYTELFCCPLGTAMSAVNDVVIDGSLYADDLRFQWVNGGSTWEQGAVIVDHAYGNDANDTIVGSPNTNVVDWLYGEDDNDTINAHPGNDQLIGGNGEDTMSGGAGDDTMDGGNGHDIMTGGPGHDNMSGGADRDFMSGNDNDDIMNGGSGPDVMCGDGEDGANPDDELDDGDTDSETPTPDIIWSSQSGDKAVCGSTSTKWDGAAAYAGTTCNGANPVYTVPPGASRPPDCP
jgi:hypothetical protein